MAIHASSTPAPARPLLRKAAAASGLLPSAAQRGDLLAILDAGPISPDAMASLSRSRRRTARQGIDALIAYLDALDGDADLEPSLGYTPLGAAYDECEGDFADDELSGDENEPSIGAVDRRLDQSRWGFGCSDDRELVNEDGDLLDLGEHDEAELSGIADLDGVAEQWGGTYAGYAVA